MFTEEQKLKISAALKEKATHLGACPICGTTHWEFQDGFIRLALQEEVGKIILGGPNLPCIALICANCGNTALLNAIRLGLRDLIEPPKQNS